MYTCYVISSWLRECCTSQCWRRQRFQKEDCWDCDRVVGGKLCVAYLYHGRYASVFDSPIDSQGPWNPIHLSKSSLGGESSVLLTTPVTTLDVQVLPRFHQNWVATGATSCDKSLWLASLPSDCMQMPVCSSESPPVNVKSRGTELHETWSAFPHLFTHAS